MAAPSRTPFTVADQDLLATFLADVPPPKRNAPSTHKDMARKYPHHTDQSWMNYYKKSGKQSVDHKIAQILDKRMSSFAGSGAGIFVGPNQVQNRQPPPPPPLPAQPRASTSNAFKTPASGASTSNPTGNGDGPRKASTTAKATRVIDDSDDEEAAEDDAEKGEEEVDELASEEEDDRPLPRASTSTSVANPPPPSTNTSAPERRKVKQKFTTKDRKRLISFLARGIFEGSTKTKVYNDLASKYPDHTHYSWQSYYSNNRVDFDPLVQKRHAKLIKRARRAAYPKMNDDDSDDEDGDGDEEGEGKADSPPPKEKKEKPKKVVKLEETSQPEAIVLDEEEEGGTGIQGNAKRKARDQKRDRREVEEGERASEVAARSTLPAAVPFSQADEDLLTEALAKAELNGVGKDVVWSLMADKNPLHLEWEWEAYYSANLIRLLSIVTRKIQALLERRRASPPPQLQPQSPNVAKKNPTITPGPVPKFNKPRSKTPAGSPAVKPPPVKFPAVDSPAKVVVPSEPKSDREEAVQPPPKAQSKSPLRSGVPATIQPESPLQSSQLVIPSTLSASNSPIQQSQMAPRPVDVPAQPLPVSPSRNPPPPSPRPSLAAPTSQNDTNKPQVVVDDDVVERDDDAVEPEQEKESLVEVVAATQSQFVQVLVEMEVEEEEARDGEKSQDDNSEREEASNVAQDLLSGRGKVSPGLRASPNPSEEREMMDVDEGENGEEGDAMQIEMGGQESDQEEVGTEALEDDDLRVEAALTASSPSNQPNSNSPPKPDHFSPDPSLPNPPYVLPTLTSLSDIDLSTSSWPELTEAEIRLKESSEKRHLLRLEDEEDDLEAEEQEEEDRLARIEAERIAEVRRLEEEERDRLAAKAEEEEKERQRLEALEAELLRKQQQEVMEQEQIKERKRLAHEEESRRAAEAKETKRLAGEEERRRAAALKERERTEKALAAAAAASAEAKRQATLAPTRNVKNERVVAPIPRIIAPLPSFVNKIIPTATAAATSLKALLDLSPAPSAVPTLSTPLPPAPTQPPTSAPPRTALPPRVVGELKRPRASSEAMRQSSSAAPESDRSTHDDSDSKPPLAKRARRDPSIKIETEASPAPLAADLKSELQRFVDKFGFKYAQVAVIYIACSCPSDLSVLDDALTLMSERHAPQRGTKGYEDLVLRVKSNCWSWEEDRVALGGTEEDKKKMDELKGKGSTTRRVRFLVRSGKTSLKKLGKNPGWPWS